MSIFDLLRRRTQTKKRARTLDGTMPIYSQFGTNIYASDVVQQALKCIVDEFKKLIPKHIRNENGDRIQVAGNIQDVLDNPNELMTTSEFLEKICWLLLMNYNAFIIPQYYTWTDEKTGQERRYYTALYPIKPSQVDFIEDASGELFVEFTFNNGQTITLKYADVIHWRYNYSVNQYMGGNENGQPDTKNLYETINMNQRLLEGVAKALDSSYAVNGVVKYNTYIDEQKVAESVQKFEQMLRENKSSILPLDLKAEYIPLEKKVQLVDKDTLAFIDSKILRHFGVSLPILTGDYTKQQLEAFYQKSIEPLVTQLSQAMTKKMFTQREKAFKNRIELYPKELLFMGTTETLEMIKELGQTGALYENEKRVALGLPPLKELEGKRYQSLNWVDSTIANQYQQKGQNDE